MSFFAGVQHTFKDFAQNTSAHGIPRASSSRGLRRVFWSTTLILCIIAFAFQAKEIVNRFFRYDVIVGVEVKFEIVSFPAVTVCNLNPYKYSLIRQIPTLNQTLQVYNAATEEYVFHTLKDDNIFEKRRIRSGLTSKKLSKKLFTVFAKCSLIKETKCICISDGSLLWHCQKPNEWKDAFCSACDLDKSLCYNNDNLKTIPCRCYNDLCIGSEYYSIRGRWPLEMEYDSCKCAEDRCERSTALDADSACICIAETSNVFYCDTVDRWELVYCSDCTIGGICRRSSSAFTDKNGCICRRQSVASCYAVEVSYDSEEDHMLKKHQLRFKRQKSRFPEMLLSRYEALLAVYAGCRCSSSSEQCTPVYGLSNDTICLCYYDKRSGYLWHCYLPDKWVEKRCMCNSHGECNQADGRNLLSCICHSDEDENYPCIKIPDSEDGDDTRNGSDRFANRLLKVWDITTTATVPTTTEALHFESHSQEPLDPKVEAEEKIKHFVNDLPESEKKALSYNKEEFITKCSFNGRECSIEEDFSTYVDPTFGNCFTFNYNASKNMTTEKAGNAYGNHVLTGLSEIQSSIRLTVHSQEEQAFPDTHGYSAPTGSVSSFGIRMKRITRLSYPYGDCVDDKLAKTSDYIYKDKAYSTEGCHRSCIQKYVAKKCTCGDPRFPPYKNIPNCLSTDLQRKNCVTKETSFASFNIDKLDCLCPQPCNQQVFTVSYSASRWPASSRSMPNCVLFATQEDCLNYYREQGALIEVFYEQLNYETLVEGEAYGFSNLLSDFGGQFGLWMGVSMITLIEFGILIAEITTKICYYATWKLHGSPTPHEGCTVSKVILQTRQARRKGTDKANNE